MPSSPIEKKDAEALSSEGVKRWSIDCKATVKMGDFSRGGVTRGNNQADDHDLGCQEKYIPCGIVDEESAALNITFGSSYKRVISSWIRLKPNGMRWMSKSRRLRD
jgi:hypothetical protein